MGMISSTAGPPARSRRPAARLITLLLYIAAGLLAFSHPVSAQAFEPVALEEIQHTAEGAVRRLIPPQALDVRVSAEGLDPRLRLAPCDQPLQGFLAGDGQLHAHSLAAVRCAGAAHWTIYVGVTIDSEQSVLCARRILRAGEVLRAEDFEPLRRVVPGLSYQYVTDPARLVGRTLLRPMAGGEALEAAALAAVTLIHRGQQLTLLARAGSLEVRTAGVALGDGTESQRIRVQNVTTQRVVEAVVRSSELAEVGL